MMNVAILISGTGSIMLSIIRHFHLNYQDKISFTVISNNPDAIGLKKANEIGIKTISINHKNYKTREQFDTELNLKLQELKIDFVVLAGFMRILTNKFVESWNGKMTNTHPSLLPAFKGANAVRDALDYGVKITGTTVHWVSSDVDCGKIIAQDFVIINQDDNELSLQERIKQKEQVLYPKVLEEIFIKFL